MIDTPFINCTERTEFSDECYGAIGRALFVAQRFEANCRALSTLLDIKTVITATKEIGSPDDPEFVKFVNELWKRSLGKNLYLLKDYGFSESVNETLDKAREARNIMAHEITLGIENKIEGDHGRLEILYEIATLIRQIAEGDKIISFLIQYVTHEPYPSPSFLQNYPSAVVEWVCGTFD